jgi:uncharacterized protein (TIGR02270 family)
MGPPVIPAVLDRHAEEAAFLWLLRDRAVGLPQFNLRTLAELDQRVEAHLDGLRVAGDHGWRRAWQEFEDRPEPGEAFAAAVLAFESTDPGRIQPVLDAAGGSRDLARAVASAVGWLADAAAVVAVPLLLAWDGPSARLIGLAGCAVRRAPPVRVLDKALRDPDPRLRCRAVKAVGELGDVARASAVRDHLKAAELEVRFAAAWALARLTADTAPVGELQGIVVTESRYRQRAADLAVRRLDLAAALRWVRVLEQVPGCERVAVQAAGALGDPVAIPSLIEKMATPALARVAGEALSLITGVHVGDDKLDRDAPPEGFEAGPTDDAADEGVDLDPDDGLDWPDPEKVRKWWVANHGRFPKGVRHLCGQPIAADHLRDVLRIGYQRQRAAAALELAVRHPREPLFEVRAPGWRQRVD